MTRKELATLLALIALPMPVMAGQRTIYANDGTVVGRYTTDTQGTATLMAAMVGSLAASLAIPSSCMTACRIRCLAIDPSGGNSEDPRPM